MKRLLLVIIIVVFAACGRKKQEVTQPVVQNITESVYASGVIKSKNQYEVYSTVNGIVEEKRAREGDIVRKGDVLLTIVNEAAALSSENARIAATYSSVAYNADRLNELKGNIDLSYEKMKNDSAVFQRQQNLWNEGIGSRIELEQKELAWKNSINNYRAAKLHYNNVKKEIDFSAKQSLKNLQLTNSTTKDYTIRARQEGRIYRILKEPGEMVNTQTPVALIGDMKEFILELKVDEFDIGKIKAGQKVFVNMDSYRGQVFEAIVTSIQPIMDEQSRSFKVEATFISSPPVLYPRLTIEANILINKKENALTIPRNYLANENEVYLKNGDKRKVVTGLKDYQQVEIISGLSREDVIKRPPQ